MVKIKSKKEIEKIREAGRVTADVLSLLKREFRTGVTTLYLNDLAKREIEKRGGTPAFLGYQGYPASICTSVEEVVVHGIPGDFPLSSGQIISIDLGVKKDGYYGDMAATFPVGEIDRERERLIEVTQKSLFLGIEKSLSGNRLSDIARVIQNYVKEGGFSVVRQFVGHGIGKSLHEEPEVPNYVENIEDYILQEGMVICIEPMVNSGRAEVKVLSDGWTAVTIDRKPSAHFEHTVSITKDKPEILTRQTADLTADYRL